MVEEEVSDVCMHACRNMYEGLSIFIYAREGTGPWAPLLLLLMILHMCFAFEDSVLTFVGVASGARLCLSGGSTRKERSVVEADGAEAEQVATQSPGNVFFMLGQPVVVVRIPNAPEHCDDLSRSVV